MKRTPLKRGNYRLKRTSAQKKANQRLLDQTGEEIRMFNFLVNLFFLIPEGNRICWSCGKKLSNEPRSYYFDHLIEKSKRPDLAMEKDNIFLCCLECHALKTDGHPTDPHREAIEKAKERFGLS